MKKSIKTFGSMRPWLCWARYSTVLLLFRKGVWRDDAQDGVLLFDNPVVIQCYTSGEMLTKRGHELREFLVLMGKETKQGAVGVVIDRDYLEIEFDLHEETS